MGDKVHKQDVRHLIRDAQRAAVALDSDVDLSSATHAELLELIWQAPAPVIDADIEGRHEASQDTEDDSAPCECGCAGWRDINGIFHEPTS